LRIKTKTTSGSQHTAATSANAGASGKYPNFHSRKLASRANKQDDDNDNRNLALSGILTSSINESNFTNEKQKISNQNALLSLLS
jgi:hypothetical protein